MHSFSEYLHHTSPEPQIARLFEACGPVLSTSLTLENFELEINALSEFEKSLPDSLNLHLDMILTGGATMVSQYYQELAGNKEKIVERLKNRFGESNFHKINEALLFLREDLKKIKLKLNEQTVADFQNKFGSITTDSMIQKAIDGAPDNEPKSSILGTIKMIWNAITDDSDPLSILQLVLDLAGLIPGEWGVAADLLNAVIYFMRKKWLLGAISVIAAVIPYAGDAIKALKLGKSAKYADDFVQYIVETPAPNVSTYFERIPIQYQSRVLKLLSLVGEKIVGAFAKGSSILSKFIKAIEKYTGAFPKVQAFFQNLGTKFEKFAAKMGKVADDLKLLPKVQPTGLSGTVFTNLTAALSPEIGKVGGKLTFDEARGMIKLTNSEGKIVREFSEKMLSDPKLWINNPSMSGFLNFGGKNTKEILEYFNALPKVAPKLKSTTDKIFSTIFNVGRAKIAVGALIGKQIIKAITGETPEKLGIPADQVELYGADFLNNAIQKKILEEKAKGVKYSPFLTFDGSNDADYQTITKYQNDWAKVIGGPEIIPVLYTKAGYPDLADQYNDFWKNQELGSSTSKFGNEEVVKKDRDFWSKVAKGEIKRDESGNLIKGEPAPVNTVVKEVPNLRTTDWYREAFPQVPNESVNLLSFDKFINE